LVESSAVRSKLSSAMTKDAPVDVGLELPKVVADRREEKGGCQRAFELHSIDGKRPHPAG
jgi:hypothetical protein